MVAVRARSRTISAKSRGVAATAGSWVIGSTDGGASARVRLDTFFRSSLGLPSGVEKVTGSGISLRLGTAWQR